MILSKFDLNSVLLLPGTISLITETELTQYFIKDWQLTFWNNGKLIKVTVGGIFTLQFFQKTKIKDLK